MARYRELIVKADDRDLIPYLAGYLAAENVSGVYFAEESGLHVSALKERFRHHGEVQHIVCTDEAAVALRDALAKAVPRSNESVAMATRQPSLILPTTFASGMRTLS